MPITRGNKNVSAIYRGNTPITAVYRGENLVWSSSVPFQATIYPYMFKGYAEYYGVFGADQDTSKLDTTKMVLRLFVGTNSNVKVTYDGVTKFPDAKGYVEFGDFSVPSNVGVFENQSGISISGEEKIPYPTSSDYYLHYESGGSEKQYGKQLIIYGDFNAYCIHFYSSKYKYPPSPTATYTSSSIILFGIQDWGSKTTMTTIQKFYSSQLIVSDIIIPSHIIDISDFLSNSNVGSNVRFLFNSDGVKTNGSIEAIQQSNIFTNTTTISQNGTWYVIDGIVLKYSPDSSETITTPSNIEYLCDSMGIGTYVKTLIISDNVNRLGSNCCNGGSQLTSVTIGTGVNKIGSDVFNGCKQLNNITIKSGNTKFDSRNNCNAIIETATNTLIIGCKNTIIPNTVTSIGSSAFYNLTNLNTISIPNSVIDIGNYAFNSCSNLTNVTFGNSITNIGANAFYNCKLNNLELPATVNQIGSQAFSSSNAPATAIFNQPYGMNIYLPTAGSVSGMFYNKTARSMTIYTDNETIKNYNWSADNITPTFYHLDGTVWA